MQRAVVVGTVAAGVVPSAAARQPHRLVGPTLERRSPSVRVDKTVDIVTKVKRGQTTLTESATHHEVLCCGANKNRSCDLILIRDRQSLVSRFTARPGQLPATKATTTYAAWRSKFSRRRS